MNYGLSVIYVICGIVRVWVDVLVLVSLLCYAVWFWGWDRASRRNARHSCLGQAILHTAHWLSFSSASLQSAGWWGLVFQKPRQSIRGRKPITRLAAVPVDILWLNGPRQGRTSNDGGPSGSVRWTVRFPASLADHVYFSHPPPFFSWPVDNHRIDSHMLMDQHVRVILNSVSLGSSIRYIGRQADDFQLR